MVTVDTRIVSVLLLSFRPWSQRAVHTPDVERVTESLGRGERGARDRKSGTHSWYPSHWTYGRRSVVVTTQHLVEEVDVPGRQAQCLDLTQLVGRQGRDDLAQLGEGVVERLCPLPLADVGHYTLVARIVDGEQPGGRLEHLAVVTSWLLPPRPRRDRSQRRRSLRRRDVDVDLSAVVGKTRPTRAATNANSLPLTVPAEVVVILASRRVRRRTTIIGRR